MGDQPARMDAGTGSDNHQKLAEAVTPGSADDIQDALKYIVETPIAGALPPTPPVADKGAAAVPSETKTGGDAGQSVPSETKTGAKGDQAVSDETTTPKPEDGDPEAIKDAGDAVKVKGLAKAWEAVTAAERRNVLTAKRHKDERAELDSARAERDKSQGSYLERLKQDPLKVLHEAGLTYEDLTHRVLNDGQAAPSEAMRVQAEKSQKTNDALLERITKLETAKTQADQAVADRQFINEYETGITSVLAEPEFELLASNPEAQKQIMQYAGGWAEQHGEVKTPREVAAILQNAWSAELAKAGSHMAVRKAMGLEAGAPPSDNDSALSDKATDQSNGKPPRRPSSLGNHAGSDAPQLRSDFDDLSPEAQIVELAKTVSPAAWDSMG